ncbi:uncharacterized protein LOC102714570 isoform X1 [Oryza brachyantha]|uniref:uncharacterized protein LOC102714570 isoform X1 n=1 Tax=Oryza brachyantha TaxID=4533 RepID=UPI0003EAB9C3|nr:uncharacterized protein LOC102714570 isoform X1 [Oryza brachyantha]XP_040381999.1 uncharacterized protein LOC102714570 isoform X1 [Oryza brachyantha]
MMEEGMAVADLREMVRLPDVLVVCTSVGWTNEKHMLYLSLLEESFLSQLHDSEYSFKKLFNHSSGACIHKVSSKGHVKNTKAEQEHMDVEGVDRAESWIKVEHVRSPCAQSSMCHLGKKIHSPSRSAEGSDQNFVDEETKGSGQPTGRCSKKRLKSTAIAMDHQVVPSVEAELQEAREKDKDPCRLIGSGC